LSTVGAGTVQPGVQVALNWNSLGITNFIQDCNKAIQLFQSYVHQMQKSAAAIEQIVAMIRTEMLVPLTLEGASGETLDLQVPSCVRLRARHAWDSHTLRTSRCTSTRRQASLHARMVVQEFFERLEKHRADKVDVLVKKYSQISNLLIKIEEVVVPSTTEHKVCSLC
jgi:hypothetical protein